MELAGTLPPGPVCLGMFLNRLHSGNGSASQKSQNTLFSSSQLWILHTTLHLHNFNKANMIPLYTPLRVQFSPMACFGNISFVFVIFFTLYTKPNTTSIFYNLAESSRNHVHCCRSPNLFTLSAFWFAHLLSLTFPRVIFLKWIAHFISSICKLLFYFGCLVVWLYWLLFCIGFVVLGIKSRASGIGKHSITKS